MIKNAGGGRQLKKKKNAEGERVNNVLKTLVQVFFTFIWMFI